MGADMQLAAARFEAFARDVLAPAVCTGAHALGVEVFQCAEPVAHAVAARASYRRVQVGWEWGPVWSTAWFRVRGSVPARLAGRCVALRFSSGSEALVWRDGVPWHGLDRNRDTLVLFENAAGGEPVDFLIEAACNHALGQLGTRWDPPEFLKHWQGTNPGKLERSELAAYDATAWRLHRAYVFALQLLRELPADSARAQQLGAALGQATGLVDAADVSGTAAPALRVVETALARPAGAGAALCHAAGHAHIDTAWLWPVRETRRKCLRTFATALRNMERFPQFVFLCSQAQQYAWVEETAPELFAQIRQRVAEGRWEPGGAMWVESDCNLLSGESLVRQIVHAARYWRRTFGAKGVQRYLYLPDTFGFTGALPQIMRLAGLETFITHKLSWNDTNKFPYTNFLWRGIDGTEVLAHCMPGHDYNLLMSPRELRRGEANHTGKDPAGAGAPARYLQPFGYGDGGGGPTDWQILHADLAAECAGVPRVHFSRAGEFCAALARDRESLRRIGQDYPVWSGELYLEAHRGTYTTQAWIKHANRRAEEGLRLAELLVWGAPAPASAEASRRLRAEQDAAWKLTLLNQFHDIIPGSSIAWVYRDAQADYANVREMVAGHVAGALGALGEQLDTTGTHDPVGVLNPTSAAQSAVVGVKGRLVYAEQIPALGVRVIDAGRAALPETGPVRIENGPTLDNGIVRCVIDQGGTISSLRRAGVDAELCAPGRGLNELMLYEDRPKNWDAWDIDAGYEQSGVRLSAASVSAMADGPPRARVEVRYETERASILQEYVLEAGSPRVDVRTIVDWNEAHRLLRALFPTTINANRATYETAFGFIQRSTRRNTSHERAAFEVPAHRWMDLSEDAGGFGLALLNDCKYGHSCHEGVMGLSLLRAPTFPDETADRGVHRFTYSLMPHAGDWRAAGVDDQAELLNTPLLAEALRPGRPGALGKEWAPLRLDSAGGARATVAALKAAEEDERVILRLVETRGRSGTAVVRWGIGVRDVGVVDLHEHPSSRDGVSHDAATRRTTVSLRPFQIVTLAAHRA